MRPSVFTNITTFTTFFTNRFPLEVRRLSLFGDDGEEEPLNFARNVCVVAWREDRESHRPSFTIFTQSRNPLLDRALVVVKKLVTMVMKVMEAHGTLTQTPAGAKTQIATGPWALALAEDLDTRSMRRRLRVWKRVQRVAEQVERALAQMRRARG